MQAMEVVVGSSRASLVLQEMVERKCKLGEAMEVVERKCKLGGGMEVVVGSSSTSKVL